MFRGIRLPRFQIRASFGAIAALTVILFSQSLGWGAADNFATTQTKLDDNRVTAVGSEIGNFSYLTNPNPIQVKLPCSDESIPEPAAPPTPPGQLPAWPSDEIGQAEYGQFDCVKAKKFLIKNFRLKVQNMQAYYYEGHTLQYINKMPGMCKLGMVVRPVCEIAPSPIKSDWQTVDNKYKNTVDGNIDNCAKRAQDIGDFDQDKCFKGRLAPPKEYEPDPAQCLDKKTGAQVTEAIAIYGQELSERRNFFEACRDTGQNSDGDDNPCDAKCQATYARDCHSLETRAWTKQIKQSVDDVEGFKNYMMNPTDGAWPKYLGSGNDYCVFTTDGFNPQLCGKEFSWLRGFKATLWQKHLEELEDEINAGVIKLKKVDNRATAADTSDYVYPCQELAMSLQYQLNGYAPDPGKPDDRIGIRASEHTVRIRYQPLIQKLGVKTDEGCLVDLLGQADAGQAALNAINANYDDQGNKLQGSKKLISQAVCNLSLSRLQLFRTVEKLLLCELDVRAKKEYHEDIMADDGSGQNKFWGTLKTEVIDKCAKWARKRKKVSLWGGCYTSCVLDCFNKCYKLGNRARCRNSSPSVGHDGIDNWMWDFSQKNIKTKRKSMPLKMVVPALQKLPQLPNTPPVPTPSYPAPYAHWNTLIGQPIPDADVKACDDPSNADADIGNFTGYGAKGDGGDNLVPTGASGGILVSFALRRRLRRAWRRRVRDLVLVMLAGLCVVFTMGASCGDDDDNPTPEKPESVSCECGGVSTVPASTGGKCLLKDSSDDATCDKPAQYFCQQKCNGPDDIPEDPGTDDEEVSVNTAVKVADAKTDVGNGSITDQVIQNVDPTKQTEQFAASEGTKKYDSKNGGGGGKSQDHAKNGDEVKVTLPTSKPTTSVGAAPSAKPMGEFGKGETGGGSATSGEKLEGDAIADHKEGQGFDTNLAAPGGRLIASSNGQMEAAGAAGGGGRGGEEGTTGEIGGDAGHNGAGGGADQYLKGNGKLSLFDIVSKRYTKWSWAMENDAFSGMKGVLPSSNEFNKKK